MNKEKSLNKYNIVLYVISTFILSWIFWVIAFTSNNVTVNTIFRVIGSLVPGVMAIIFIKHFYKIDGLKGLLKRLTMYKVKPIFYAFIFFYSLASFYLPSLICLLLGQEYKIQIRTVLFGFDITNPLSLIGCLLTILFLGGPFGEELGWRGFLLPKLQKKYVPLVSGIIIGVVWTLWHIPMFLFHVEGYNGSFLLFLIQTICISVIYTWLYNCVKGSLIIPLIYHTMDNFIASICFPEFLNHINMYTIIYWVIQLVVLVLIIFSMIYKKEKFEDENYLVNSNYESL